MPSPILNAIQGGYQSFRNKATRVVRLPDFRGNYTTGSTIVSNLGLGPTFHAFFLMFVKAAGVVATEAEIIAQVGRVRITVDGDPKIDLTGAEAAMLANLHSSRGQGLIIQGGVLPIWLARPWWAEFASQDGPAWGTADVGSITIEVTFTGTVTIVSCLPRAMVTQDSQPLGRHLTIRRLVDSQSAAGMKSISDFKADPMKQLVAVHIDKGHSVAPAGPIQSFQWKANQNVEWEGEGEILDSLYRNYEVLPVTGWTSWLFAMRGRPQDAIPMVMADLRLELQTGVALTTFNVLCEYAEGEAVAA